jgi:hypothetical protein
LPRASVFAAKEALARIHDELLAKHVQNGAQDGAQNQIESKPSAIAEMVASGAKEAQERA